MMCPSESSANSRIDRAAGRAEAELHDSAVRVGDPQLELAFIECKRHRRAARVPDGEAVARCVVVEGGGSGASYLGVSRLALDRLSAASSMPASCVWSSLRFPVAPTIQPVHPMLLRNVARLLDASRGRNV
jgi:hypothetical protein